MSAELAKRVLTAAIALPLTVALLWRGGWPAVTLISAASALATWEFYRLTPADPLALRSLGVLMAAVLPWLPLWSPAGAGAIAVALITLTSMVAGARLVLRQDIGAAWNQTPLLVQGLVFCGLGPFFLSSLLVSPSGPRWVLAVLLTTFANDGTAFLGGKRFGKRRLAAKVSPGKTWEGWGFGALGSTAASAILAALWPDTVTVLSACVLAVTTAVVGPMGDLMKSLLKRARGVKDSGRLFPGHGGMLDRIDAVLVNAPVIWAWVKFGGT